MMKNLIFVLLLGVFTNFVIGAPEGKIGEENGNFSSIHGEIFRADFTKSSLSQAFGGVGVSYGTQNVILWASGGGIDVVYPAGSYKVKITNYCERKLLRNSHHKKKLSYIYNIRFLAFSFDFPRKT